MLYSIILVAIILVFAVFSQIMVLKAVKFGMKYAENPEKAVEEPIFELPKKEKAPEPVELPEGMQMIVDQLEGLDKFDGMPKAVKENE